MALAACPSSSNVFTCASDSDCTGAGNGTCQANGFCAFPDAMCESGMRYGDLAGGGFANMCVPVDAGSTGDIGGSIGSSTTMETSTVTTLEPGTSGDGSTSDGSGSSGQADASSGTAGPPACQVFEDDFAGDLAGFWDVVGSGSVFVENGTLDFVLGSSSVDAPIVLQYDATVPLESSWVMANLLDLPERDGVRMMVMLLRDTPDEAYGLIIETGSRELVAVYRSGNAGFDRLGSTPFTLDTPWLRVRESEGRVSFEFGASPDTLVVFHEESVDIRDWLGTFSIGADNAVTLDEDTVVTIDDAAGCVVR